MVQGAAPRAGDDKEVVARFDLPAGLLEGRPSTAEKAPARPSRASPGKSQVLDDYPVSTLDLVKYAIFIIDCNRATVLAQSKPSGLEELKFRCVEAMGLRASEESVRMELLFAGYDGPERAPLYTDQQLESFLNTLPQDVTGQSKGDAAVQAALAMQRAEYEKIIRELNDKIEDLTDLNRKMKQRNAELEEDAEKMVEQMKLRLEQAEVDIEKRCRKEFKKLLAQKEAEWKVRIDELRRKLSEMKKLYEAEAEKVLALDKEVQALEKRLVDELEEKKKLQARIKELEPFVAKCDALQAEADLWRKRYEQLLKECEREDDPPRLEDSNTFEWAIPGMSGKLKFPKGRAVQSPEFQIAGLKEPVQIEFFPKGDSTTWDGWCAVKIRVPDETQLLWSAWVGTCRAGPRLDLFDQNSWWCRQGLLWSNFCLVHDLMQQIDDADSLICGIEVHAVGPFAREMGDPQYGPSDPDHPLPLERRPRTPLSSRNQTRLDPAAQQWQGYGFLELEEGESPRPQSKQQGTRLLPDVGASPPKSRQAPQGRAWTGFGTLEPLSSRPQTLSRGSDFGGVGLSRSIQSRSESRLSRLGTPMALQDIPGSPAYTKMGWAGSPGGSRPGSRAHSPPRF